MTILRLADHDWLTAHSDAPADTRFEGLIDPSGVTITQQLGWWPADEKPAQAAAAQVRLLDPNGVLDGVALGDISGAAVAIEQVDLDGAYADKVSIARFVVDKVTVEGDMRKTLHLRDAHDQLDNVLNPGEFPESVTGPGGQTQPAVIGAVSNAPGLMTGSDGSVVWLADAPVSVAVLRDRADAMEAGTYTADSYNQQLKMAWRPIGPMTADLSSIGLSSGEPIPATLAQALREVFRRAGITAWSLSDAQAIDTATGYAGIGYYAGSRTTVRQALQAILGSYGAWYYQDDTGTLRFARIVDPSLPGDADFELDGGDLAEDLTFTNDTAPALTTRMAWRPNARVMSESDFVTDIIDVPPSLRAQLTSQYAGVVTAAGVISTEYRSALDAEPYISLFWREIDAQTEVTRRAALYSGQRRTYKAVVKADVGFAPLPGQRVLMRYPKYGMDAGRKLLVRRVDRNPATGDCTCYLWGA